MIPLPCRILVWIASLIVPAPKRTEWRKEWTAELWHRSQSGASFGELLGRSVGVFRDAAWMQGNERMRNPFDIFRKPLRTKALFLAASLAICMAAGDFVLPAVPGRRRVGVAGPRDVRSNAV